MENSGNDKGDDQKGDICMTANSNPKTTTTTTTLLHLQHWGEIWTKSKYSMFKHTVRLVYLKKLIWV